MRRFESKEGGSNKFWSVELKGTALSVAWGKIGTDGQSKKTMFPSTDAARNEHDKLIVEKLKKGYLETKGAKAPKPAPAKAPHAKAAKGTAPEPLLHNWKLGKYGGGVSVHPDGKLVAAFMMPVLIVELASGKIVKRVDGEEAFTPVFAPDGALFGLAEQKVWALGDGGPQELIDLGSTNTPDIAFTRDRIVGAGWDQFTVWDRKGKVLLHKKRDTTGTAVRVSRDGKTALVVGETLEVWSTTNGSSKVHKIPPGTERATLQDLAFTHDGQRAVGLWMGGATLFTWWDLKSGKVTTKNVPDLLGSDVTARLSCTPDGQRMITAGEEIVAIWSADGELLASMKKKGAGEMKGWQLTPDGTRLLCEFGDKHVRVYDVAAIEAGGVRVKTT